MASNARMTLRARWVFPVEGEPIADGMVEVEGGRIASVGPAGGRTADRDFGNAAILPGLVNAHTHLDLAEVREEGATGDQVEWLRAVVRQRREADDGSIARTIARNLAEALASGTTLLADITRGGRSWEAVASAPVRAVVYSELIGLRRGRALQSSHEAWSWLANIGPAEQVGACARAGLSPHAPYSTAGWLYERAAGSQVPLTTHLAELPEELELLRTGGHGRLREFLEEMDAWDEDWEPIGPTPADYIRRGTLRQADWLVVHGTYLDPSDFWQLRAEAAPAGQRVAVAFCPRTHARFGHAPHPYRALMERGVVVCLGTDGRASSPSLSVLDEMRFLHRADPSLNGPVLLAMGTLFGAWALRAEGVTGSLKPGKSADLAIVALADRDGEPHGLLLDSEGPVIGTMFEGRMVHES